MPGIIGAVGTIFGRHNVNIAQMAVGRAAPGGEAVGVLNLERSRPPRPWQRSGNCRRSRRPRSSTCRRRASCRAGCSSVAGDWLFAGYDFEQRASSSAAIAAD